MKKNYGLVLTSLVLMSMALFLIFVTEGREEQFLLEQKQAAEAVFQETVETEEPEQIASAFAVSLRYEDYRHTSPYYVVIEGIAEIRSDPSLSAQVVGKVRRFEKLDAIENAWPVDEADENRLWYPVVYDNDGKEIRGFIESTLVRERRFEFARMEEAVSQVDSAVLRNELTYIESYYDPKRQTARGYVTLSDLEQSIPLEDGTLVRYLFSHGKYTRVAVVATGQRYYVLSGFLAEDVSIQKISRVIVIDRANQNEAAFEKIDGLWTRVSQTLATTGTNGRYSKPTSLGFFYAMEKKEQFTYYMDGTTRIQGYAPYAIRFNGGAYIHGVPVDFRHLEDGQRVAPPMQEYSLSIGTIPLSHKCVRNYTSHAKFLYDWYVPLETVVIVIE